MTTLYSYNGEEPKPLGGRLRFPDGTTKTDESTWTQEELAECGYTGPYTAPVDGVDYNATEKFYEWNSLTLSFDLKPHPQPPEPTLEEAWERFRWERDNLLRGSDWTQIPDAPLSSDKVEEWKVYRQALRELPELPELDVMTVAYDLSHEDWPTQPA